MTEKEVHEAAELIETRKAFKLSPEEFGEIVCNSVWAVMVPVGRDYVDKRLRELGVEQGKP